ncbi:MAG TPA: hypothetical protein PLS12_11525, partial [Bacteroidales bacterium]|nr:hypothetical protein [Bacteroidales bacterium]
MKKIVTIVTVIMSLSVSTFGQVNPHAIGLRLGGDGNVNGAEFSYQHGMGEANRLEFDLGFRGNKNYNSMYVSGVYQWDWNLTSGLNWYVGPGAALGFYNWDDGNTSSSGLHL